MQTNPTVGWLLPGLALVAGILGISAIWVTAAVLSNRSCSWLALASAIDMALLLHLTRAPPGPLRVCLAMLATTIAVVLSQWLIVASHLGLTLGLQPLASATRLGPALAWELSKLSLDRVDLVWLLSAVPLAAILTHVAGVRRGSAP